MGKGSHNAPLTSNNNVVVENNNAVIDDVIVAETATPYRLPTLSEIKSKIPSRCFRPTVKRSMYYVVMDIIYVTLTYLTMFYIQKWFQYGFLLLPLYWYVQGTLYTSIFVLGHDCGHSSFSAHPLLNDVVGTILHTFILAPYYPWKVTHNKHHKNTANMDKDEIFYPNRITDLEAKQEEQPSLTKSKLSSINVPYFGVGAAWFYYLIYGYSPRTVNHFNPFLPIFYYKHLTGVLISLFSYLFMICLMFLYATKYGFLNLISFHLIPVFIFACYMVMITFLHHTEIDVPWYSNEEWNYVQGQLSTVDRHYGHVHSVIHSIGTHQIHHLFTKVPHYHLEEATEHFRRSFPDLVRIKEDGIVKSFIRMFKIFIKQRTFTGNDIRIFNYKEDKSISQKNN